MLGSLRMWIGSALVPACWSPGGITVRAAAVVLALCWMMAAASGAPRCEPRSFPSLLEPIGDFTPWCSAIRGSRDPQR